MIFGFVTLFIISIAAFAVSAVSGGGAGLIMMPVLGLLLTADHVPAALSIGTAVSSMSRIALFFQTIQWQIVLRFVPLALPAAWAGILLLKHIQPAYLDFFLGLFLLSNLPLMLRRRKSEDKISEPPSITWLPVIGALAGFISGFTGAVGLLFNGFYHRLGLRKEEIVATRAADDILLHLVKVGLYTFYGLVDQNTVAAGIIVAVAALASSFIMKASLHLIPDHLFRQIGHSAAVIAGIAMISLAGSQITSQNHIEFHFIQNNKQVELAVDWKQHQLSIELESPTELEISHILKSQDASVERIASVLHFSPTRGLYVTHLEKNFFNLSLFKGEAKSTV
ncbi:sulfite exporter TauE/SafE family protein [Acetobacter sicerae]|uniref:sulfite exporter TauE/SafE family protein n=1 Tax=Acetobacter sicerae TaxID=85325 RepID=UPI00156B1D3C|nr:sulfite exporter TauE/SafE family protein [Acetobacter sicerae]NHN93825.1 TSUP family transporter [Acetobacter sicerae]